MLGPASLINSIKDLYRPSTTPPHRGLGAITITLQEDTASEQPAATAPHQQLHGAASLPAGCCIGTPIVTASIATVFPVGDELVKILPELVRRDDFNTVMELVRNGHSSVFERRRCSFRLSLMPEREKKLELFIRDANMLQYAISINAFRVAASLILVSPAMLSHRCCVQDSDDLPAHYYQRAPEEGWRASDLVHLLYDLYHVGAETCPDVRASLVVLTHTLTVLLMVDHFPYNAPFIHLPTAKQRFAAANWNIDRIVHALLHGASACTREDWLKLIAKRKSSLAVAPEQGTKC